eukprot:3428012-Prymnesium_polylepis.2
MARWRHGREGARAGAAWPRDVPVSWSRGQWTRSTSRLCAPNSTRQTGNVAGPSRAEGCC